MKPGPEISTTLQMPSRSRAATIRAAASRGGRPAFLASAMAALTWMSANWEGLITGSVPRNSSPNALAIAAWTLGITNSAGLFTLPNYQPLAGPPLPRGAQCLALRTFPGATGILVAAGNLRSADGVRVGARGKQTRDSTDRPAQARTSPAGPLART